MLQELLPQAPMVEPALRVVQGLLLARELQMVRERALARRREREPLLRPSAHRQLRLEPSPQERWQRR